MSTTRPATRRGGFGHGGLLVPITIVGFVAGLLVVLLRPPGKPSDGSSWWWVDRVYDFVLPVGGAGFAAAVGLFVALSAVAISAGHLRWCVGR